MQPMMFNTAKLSRDFVCGQQSIYVCIYRFRCCGCGSGDAGCSECIYMGVDAVDVDRVTPGVVSVYIWV